MLLRMTLLKPYWMNLCTFTICLSSSVGTPKRNSIQSTQGQVIVLVADSVSVVSSRVACYVSELYFVSYYLYFSSFFITLEFVISGGALHFLSPIFFPDYCTGCTFQSFILSTCYQLDDAHIFENVLRSIITNKKVH